MNGNPFLLQGGKNGLTTLSLASMSCVEKTRGSASQIVRLVISALLHFSIEQTACIQPCTFSSPALFANKL
jgi:hypothetical protein